MAQKLAAAQILIVAKNQGGKVPAQGEAFKTNILGAGADSIVKMMTANLGKQTDAGAPGPLLNKAMCYEILKNPSMLDTVNKWAGASVQGLKEVSDGMQAVQNLRAAIIKKVAENLSKLPQPAQGSPERKFMPQFDPKATPAGPKVKDVSADAAAGEFNIAPPFVKESLLRKAIRKAVLQEIKRLKKK